jgi:arylsulfatase A-like enzyme
MPNRASIFTGLYPSQHQVRCNGINLNPKIPTITEKIRKSGYYTKSIGKIHHQFYGKLYPGRNKSAESLMSWLFKRKKMKIPLPYYGFEDVELTVGHGDVILGNYMDWLEELAPQYIDDIMKQPELMGEIYYDTPIPEEFYSTSYLTQRAINFLDQYSRGNFGDKPFFLFCSYPDPHHPVCPPGKYRELYDPEEIDLPASYGDYENVKKHEFLGAYLDRKDRTDMFYKNVNEYDTKKFTSLTYGSITMIDDSIGKIMNALNKSGLDKNTIIIFTSDHGDLMGDHGLVLKGPAHFHGVLNVPLIWKIPGYDKNKLSNALVSSIDIPSTILDLLGIEPLKSMQGYSISPLLRNPDDNNRVRDHILIEDDDYEHSGKGISTSVRTLITEDHRLTTYRNYESIGDLYDLRNDPNEMRNLWDNTDYKKIKYNLLNKMLHNMMRIQSSLLF